MIMPTLVDKNNCSGCSACASICEKEAITMVPNEEGFLHPIIDSKLCVNCGLCGNVCPGLIPAKNKKNDFIAKAYIVQHKDDNIRYQSTSGGAFTAIAEEVIRRGGVVFGAALNDDLYVHHISVSKVAELARFRNSKYVQSEIGNTYKEAKSLLKNDTSVCFSGTPCQINGLCKFLGKDYANLITVDVVCKSVPSPLVFDKYVEFKKLSEKKITDIVFRDKKRGFLYCTMAHYSTHNNKDNGDAVYRRGSESDEWLRLFLSGRISRRSCNMCHYQTRERVSDITLGDIWETHKPEFDDNKGTTMVHVWTNKGRDFLDSISSNINCANYAIEKSDGVERSNTVTLNTEREQLFKDANSLSAELFFNKYAPYSLIVRLKNFGRYAIWKLHLHSLVRRIKHLIIHRKK